MPYTHKQLQALELTAQFASQNPSMVSRSLNDIVHAAQQVHVTAPKLVPDTVLRSSPLAETQGGQVLKTQA